MSYLIDTSALYALMDESDSAHQAAKECWKHLLEEEAKLIIHDYLLLETHALVQSRLNMEAVRLLHTDLLLPVRTVWVQPDIVQRAVDSLLASDNRSISLVDQVSFVLMRDRNIETVFGFDRDFSNAGFDLLPSGNAE